ncbi:MAG: chemotaxis protein CheD [bacterium]|nr:chemotaxis protein CheD [bacterium]
MPMKSDTHSSQIIVDLADMKASNNPLSRMSTYALGACVAVAVYDPEVRVGGLLHYMLPDSSIDMERAFHNPFLFADTGIPLLFRRAYKLGAVKERIQCKLAGASNVLDPNNFFNIGLRNLTAARKILSKNNVTIQGEYIGGLSGMTLTMYLMEGRIVVKLPNGGEFGI